MTVRGDRILDNGAIMTAYLLATRDGPAIMLTDEIVVSRSSPDP